MYKSPFLKIIKWAKHSSEHLPLLSIFVSGARDLCEFKASLIYILLGQSVVHNETCFIWGKKVKSK